ncbi:MAG: hypothetical protein UZ22_OP11002000356 [Microgenomates bacterium OLB23]|nr:MAG: hypothetical protein UZ22_OP11002000356 [Microgenomates bacterium OLB23]
MVSSEVIEEKKKALKECGKEILVCSVLDDTSLHKLAKRIRS